MDLNDYIEDFKSKIIFLWNKKTFRYGLLINLFYLVLSITLFFIFLKDKNDFIIFYNAGRIFLTDIENLYSQTNYLWDFRYLPLSAILFIPFSIFSFEVSFVFFNICNFLLNIVISFLLLKLIMITVEDGEKEKLEGVVEYLSYYLMGLPHILNYIYGQINLYVTFFLLISLVIFLTRNSRKSQLLASFFLGISVVIKPTSIFLIPFLFIIQLNRRKSRVRLNFSHNIVRLVGVSIPLLFNLIMFVIYPSLFNGFIATNLTGSNPVAINFSYSLTKFFTNLFFVLNIPFNQMFVLISVVLIFSILGLVAYNLGKIKRYQILYGYTLGMVIMLLGYFDSWDHHLLNLTPLLILILFNLDDSPKIRNNYIKPSFFFFNFVNLVFVGLWYLIYPLFPFNIGGTIFLILTFLGVLKLLLKKEVQVTIQKDEIREG